MSAISYPPEDTQNLEHESDSLESSIGDSQTQVDSLPPLLPRSAWNSQVAFLRVLFRTKKALDRIEKEAGVWRN
jgi:hypothetical protein